MGPPSKTQRKHAQAAADAFDAHFAHEYGAERWGTLRQELARPTEYAALVNAYAPAGEVDRSLLSAAPSDAYSLFRLPALHAAGASPPTRLLCLTPRARTDGALPFPAAHPANADNAEARLHTHWSLDAASVLAAHMLDVRPGNAVLDLCAAPGGKSIVLAQRLWPERYADRPAAAHAGAGASVLHANEVDAPRNKRLASNLRSYLPPSLFRSGNVEVLRIDGAAPRAAHMLPFGEEGYDRVLLDAPCSSERHVIHAHVKAQQAGQVAPEMSAWKPNGSRSMAKLQLALLRNAWAAVKPGGQVLYATCSLSGAENDGVVSSFLERSTSDTPGVHAEIVWDASDDPVLNATCERTRYGRFALPDRERSPWGPLYFCVLRKVEGDAPAPGSGEQAGDAAATTDKLRDLSV